MTSQARSRRGHTLQVPGTPSLVPVDAGRRRRRSLPQLLLLLFGDWLGARFASVEQVGAFVSVAWKIGRWVLIVMMINIAVNLIYHLSLPTRPRWRPLTAGSTFAVIAWIGMSLVFQAALGTFIRLGTTYGSIGGTIAAGLLVGATEKLAEVYLGPALNGGIETWFAYLVALIFLLFRPFGLFGEPSVERV